MLPDRYKHQFTEDLKYIKTNQIIMVWGGKKVTGCKSFHKIRFELFKKELIM
jgi:hypothetical protein